MNKHLTRNEILGIVLGLVGICFLLILIASLSSSNNSSDNQSATNVSNVDPACTTSLTDLQKQATKVSYAELEKDPDSYKGDIATFTGQVLQIQQDGNDGVMRISVTYLGYGVYSPSDILYVTYHTSTPVVDNDIVTVTGTLTGTQTYTSEANYQITLPSMDTCGSDILEASSAKGSAHTSVTPVPAVSTSQPTVPVESTPAQPVVAAPPATSATWHTVFNDSDQSSVNTPSFTLQGTEQKIDYSCSVLDSTQTDSYFNGSIESTQGLGSGYNNFANVVNCPTSQSTYEYSLSPGQYYLDLEPNNARFSVTVEDYY